MTAAEALLIANRGEIVCRIARTAQRLGMDRDRGVFRRGPRARGTCAAPTRRTTWGRRRRRESYLEHREDHRAGAARGRRRRASGLRLSLGERRLRPRPASTPGLIFVGPPAAAIRAMGSKSASKAAMAAAGVPVAPGYHGEDQSPQRLLAEAQRVGFPLIIKASAGGGGKGMQVVNSAAEVAAAVESAQRLARTAFGDDRLLLERYFPPARHVEVQVFADSHGGIVSAVRSRLLGAAPPSEDHRGGAGAGPARGGARRHGAGRHHRRRARSATWARARSSSWSTRPSNSTSWK